MLIAVVVAGLAIIVLKLGAQRMLLVEQIKQLRIINMMVEKIDGIDLTFVGERAQLEINLEGKKYG